MSLDLYRVGEPSIGETWPRRFNHSRSTGGLGAGVYAFRDEWAAKSNTEDMDHRGDVVHLPDALENPVQPKTREATDALNKLSRKMSLVYSSVDGDEWTWDRVFEQGRFLRVSLTGGLGGDPGLGEGSAISEDALDILFSTPELQAMFGYDTDDFIESFLRATKEADERVDDRRDESAVQPINVLLSDRYDGIAPLDGAGGNTGYHGCVIFKEKIDRCVGKTTSYAEQVDTETLINCFEDN